MDPFKFYADLYEKSKQIQNETEKNLFYKVHLMRAPDQICMIRHIFEDGVLHGNCDLIKLLFENAYVSVAELEQIFGHGWEHPIAIAKSTNDFDMVATLEKIGFEYEGGCITIESLLEAIENCNENDSLCVEFCI